MNNFDEICSLKDRKKKKEKLEEYYKNDININYWLTNNSRNSIINFHNRIEYKKFNKYHRINGPAIDYGDESLNKYYYKGKLFENKEEWERKTLKDLRRIKIKKLKNINN